MPADKDEATRNKPGAVGEDKEEPLAVKQSKKMPKRSKRFGRVLQGKGSCIKRQCTNHYLDVNLDMSSPIPMQLVPFHFPHQDPTVRENDDTHVPPQGPAARPRRGPGGGGPGRGPRRAPQAGRPGWRASRRCSRMAARSVSGRIELKSV